MPPDAYAACEAIRSCHSSKATTCASCDVADDVAVLVLDCDAKSNALTPAVVDEMHVALDRITADGGFGLLVLCSGKAASFAHGPDPAWLAAHGTPQELTDFAERGQRLCGRIADMALPSVAVIAGACLGVGLELALACDYRVAVQRPATLLGFTQIELGLLPCWGGTQRLPRLIGLESSLQPARQRPPAAAGRSARAGRGGCRLRGQRSRPARHARRAGQV